LTGTLYSNLFVLLQSTINF